MSIFDKFLNKEQKAKLEDTVKGLYDKTKVKATELKETLTDDYHTVKSYVNGLKDSIYTDGKFDKDKAQKILENTEDAIKIYGNRAVTKMKEAVAASAEKMQDYTIPTQEEIKTKYEGMGSRYKDLHPNAVLFRADYNNCLEFLKVAETFLPSDTRQRVQIIKDIKDSASENRKDLLNFYTEIADRDTLDHTLKERVEEVKRYM